MTQQLLNRLPESRKSEVFYCQKNYNYINVIESTFGGKISVAMMYGIGIRPMQLKNTILAKQRMGIHSYAGFLSHRKQ